MQDVRALPLARAPNLGKIAVCLCLCFFLRFVAKCAPSLFLRLTYVPSFGSYLSLGVVPSVPFLRCLPCGALPLVSSLRCPSFGVFSAVSFLPPAPCAYSLLRHQQLSFGPNLELPSSSCRAPTTTLTLGEQQSSLII